WETTIILGAQRVKRCISSLPVEQQKVFLLRHHFQLTYEQIAAVINETPEDVMAWLFRARVQIVKCLGRG
ncbi:sigma factor-like helix-turn-helix DNA-binding protein, partial [Acinetobacter baumannii]